MTRAHEHRSWGEAFRVYLDRRVLSLFFLGFSSGLPLLLVFSTLSAWLKEAGVSKTTIGFVSLVSTAYSLKFLWSPLVDRISVPLLGRLGRRRGWMLLTQLVLMGAIAGMAGTDPSTLDGLRVTILWAVVVAFASATQDIAIDAYRVEILPRHELGAGAASLVTGYRIGMLAAGAGSLFIAHYQSWEWAYLTMAALMAVGMIAVLVNPEPPQRRSPESIEREERALAFLRKIGHLPRLLRDWLGFLYGGVVCPFADFMRRPAWWLILLFVALYKYGDALLGVMANPFYLEMGFSKAEIAAISKGFGLAMTLIGTALGGALVARLGILRALLIGGVLQAFSNLVFVAQAIAGHSIPMLVATIGIENLTGGIGTAAFVAYLASLCNVAYTATQYALLSSFMSFGRTLFASGGGWLADQVSWVSFFLISTAAAIPGLVLLLWLMRVYKPSDQAVADRDPTFEADTD